MGTEKKNYKAFHLLRHSTSYPSPHFLIRHEQTRARTASTPPRHTSTIPIVPTPAKMLFFNAIASFAAFAACITPSMKPSLMAIHHARISRFMLANQVPPVTVLSAPTAEPNVGTTSALVRRGELTDYAQTCKGAVESKCNEISAYLLFSSSSSFCYFFPAWSLTLILGFELL